MKATDHPNVFVGIVPGMDCKSEWLLNYGLNDFTDNRGDEKLEVTLIVKLDSEVAKLFDRLKGWYAFLDGEKRYGDDVASIAEEGRYLLAYLPYEQLLSLAKGLAEDRMKANAQTDGQPSEPVTKELLTGLVMTTALRRGPSSSAGKKGFDKDPERRSKKEQAPVIMGIIDDGIAVAHERFRNKDGSSRIRYFWDQRERSKEESSEELPYGREFTGAEIDRDEESFYRKNLSELADPNNADTRLLRPVTHGSAVLDLAAGTPDRRKIEGGNESGNEEPSEIIAVQLPPTTVTDTSGVTFLEQYVMSGLLYILDRARRFTRDGTSTGDPSPVVINFSFGTIAGPHDGTHQLERLFDEAVERQGDPKYVDSTQAVRLIIPAGNSHQSRCHAEFLLEHNKPVKPVTLNWRLQPDDHSPNWLHIWLPPGELSNSDFPFALKITAPSGESFEGLPLTESQSVRIFEGAKEDPLVLGLASYTVTRSESPRGHLCIALRQTATHDSEMMEKLAPAGLWQITLTLKKDISIDQRVQAWIERDDSVIGYRRLGRQSYFDHADYEVYDSQGRPKECDDNDSIIKRAGMMNAIATGRNTITVGAARGDSNKPSGYSAGGPLHHTTLGEPAIDRTDRRVGVDLLAIADDSAIHTGIIAAGTYSGSTAVLNGTSVAAPQVARMVADDLAARKIQSLSELHSKCLPPSDDDTVEVTRSGFGTVDGRADRPRRREID